MNFLNFSVDTNISSSDDPLLIFGIIFGYFVFLACAFFFFVWGYKLINSGFKKKLVLRTFIGIIFMGFFPGIALFLILKMYEQPNQNKH